MDNYGVFHMARMWKSGGFSTCYPHVFHRVFHIGRNYGVITGGGGGGVARGRGGGVGERGFGVMGPLDVIIIVPKSIHFWEHFPEN